jgi:hypothetical protein
MSEIAKDIMKDQAILEFSCSAKVLEMADAPEAIDVPMDPRIDFETLTAGDPSPMFVNLEILRTGTSEGNRRYFNNSVVRQVSDMVPGVQGFLGHPDPSKTSFEFREPHSIYVGSIVQEIEGGSLVRSLAKAYIFPSSPLREWIPKSIAANNPLTVSINGTGDIARDSVNNLILVQSMNKLDSIDWANPGTQGVPTASAYSIVSEMQGGVETMAVERIEIIKDATIAELKENNKAVVDAIQNEARITEISVKIGGTEKMVKISEMQSVIDTQEATIATQGATITEMKNEAIKDKLDIFKNAKIAEMVDPNYIETVAKRVTGTTEAEIEASITSEIAFIQEIAGDRYSNLPKGKGAKTTTEDVKDSIKNLFGVKPDKK